MLALAQGLALEQELARAQGLVLLQVQFLVLVEVLFRVQYKFRVQCLERLRTLLQYAQALALLLLVLNPYLDQFLPSVRVLARAPDRAASPLRILPGSYGPLGRQS